MLGVVEHSHATPLDFVAVVTICDIILVLLFFTMCVLLFSHGYPYYQFSKIRGTPLLFDYFFISQVKVRLSIAG
jgi:hypothetical protein